MACVFELRTRLDNVIHGMASFSWIKQIKPLQKNCFWPTASTNAWTSSASLQALLLADCCPCCLYVGFETVWSAFVVAHEQRRSSVFAVGDQCFNGAAALQACRIHAHSRCQVWESAKSCAYVGIVRICSVLWTPSLEFRPQNLKTFSYDRSVIGNTSELSWILMSRTKKQLEVFKAVHEVLCFEWDSRQLDCFRAQAQHALAFIEMAKGKGQHTSAGHALW